MEIANELAVMFEKKVNNGRIKDRYTKKLINLYLDEIKETYREKIGERLTSRRLTSLMVLRYLIASGDDMELHADAATFQKAYRQIGLLGNVGAAPCDSDAVMWNLMHDDALIWVALEKFIAWRDSERKVA